LRGEERRQYRKTIFNIEDDNFLALNVNRNQARKDLARTMAYYHQFHVKHPHSLLYMHAQIADYGGNLTLQAKMVGCDIHAQPAEIGFSTLDLTKPWPTSELNMIYNAADVLVSTSYGEGWGLTTTEALAAELPVLVPGNTANFDIVGEHEERGYLARTGGDLDHTHYLYESGGGSPHDIVHLDSFLEKLSHIYLHRDEAKAKARAGRAWCQHNTWEHRGEEWRKLVQLISQLA